MRERRVLVQDSNGVLPRMALEILARHGVMMGSESVKQWRRELRGGCFLEGLELY